MESNEQSSPSPYPPIASALFKDISNFKTPKRPSQIPNFTSPSSSFFTASKQTPRPLPSSVRRRPQHKTATSRRLKAFELEQLQSSRKLQIKKEQALKSLSKSLTTWLNFLLQNPRSCGCHLTTCNDDDCGDGCSPDNPGKRQRDVPPWRSPKRLKGSDYVEIKGTQGFSSAKSNELLRNSLKDVCSLDDLKQRMRVYLSLSTCKEIFNVMSLVVKNIDEGRLKMKSHCPIVTDVGMKEKAIRVLMCYNPIWLRIGLHIIFGGDLLLSNGDVKSDQEIAFLKMVIERQFFAHAGLAKAYAYNKMVEGLYRPGYYENLGSVILKRFFLLVLILDKAKSHSALSLKYGIDGVDGGSPLLFMIQLGIKSSRQMINDFLSSEIMLGEGNLLAHLVIIGYKVSYQQCPLVEYDFRVTDLFTDLQDGLRLCRAIQLLQNDSSILMKMVVPSDTRKKSLANCGIALQYLKHAGVRLHDDDGMEIMEDDIASGDKELTIGLLWSIFVHLQMPLLINSTIFAEEILKIYGTIADSSKSNILSSSTLELLLNWIQAVCDKYDYKVDSFSSLVDGKAVWCLLDYYFRKELSCSRSHKDTTDNREGESIMSAADYTDAVHNFILSQKLITLLGNFPEILQVSDILEHSGAISERSVIIVLVFLASQLTAKKAMDRLNFHRLLCCNCLSPERRHSNTEPCGMNLNAALDHEEIDGHCTEDAAKKFKAIKAWWQDMAERSNGFVTKLTISNSQSSSTEKSSIDFQKDNAATLIQSHFRRTIARCNFLKRKNAVLLLQNVIHAWFMVKHKSAPYRFSIDMFQESIYERWEQSERERRCVKFIVDRNSFLKLRRSVVLIQKAARIWMMRRLQAGSTRNHELSTTKIINAAIVVQKYFRCWRARSRYQVIKASHICQVYRSNVETEAATKIHLSWKHYIANRSLHNQHLAAVKIQQHFRCWQLRRKFLKQKEMIIKLQRCYHCWISRSRCQVIQMTKGNLETEAMIKIQLSWKHYIANKSLQNQHLAAVKIQQHFRCRRLRRKFLKQKEMIIKLQRCCRCWISRSRCQVTQMTKGTLETEAVIKIQLSWKHYIANKSLQNQHLAAVKIQQHLRCWQLRRKFLKQKEMVIKLQRCCRCWISRSRCQVIQMTKASLMRQVGCSNLETEAAIKIQLSWKNYTSNRSLYNQHHVAIKIQNHFRCWLLRRKFLKQKEQITKVQKCYRGWLIRRNFMLQREVAIRFQSTIRRSNCQKTFHCSKNAAIEIQRFIRGQITRKRLLGASHFHVAISGYSSFQASVGYLESFELKIIQSSIQKLQRWWRGVLLLKLRTRSAIIIQSYFRCWIGRQRAERRYATMIQSHWKGYLVRKESRGQLLDLRLRVEKSAKNVDDRKRIINRLKMALSELLSMKSISGILHTCATLDITTQHSQKCCEELVAAGAIGILLKLVRSVSRSIPDQEVLKHALSTIRNLTRYQHLTEELIDSHGSIEIIFWEFLRNKEEGYFIASEILRKICSNKKGAQSMRRLPALLKRLHSLVEELTRKSTIDKRNPQGVAAREKAERRLREAVGLLKLMMATTN